MSRKIAGALALITAVWLAPVHALGLGDVDVRSRLNQPFSAVIPVIDATAADTETLSVKLASAADFDKGGVDRADYLTTLAFSLDPSGRVLISSKQIAREPLLNFIVEARWRGGRVLREYTVFLDPPSSAVASSSSEEPSPVPVKAAPRAAAPVIAPAAAPVRAAPTPEPVAAAPAPRVANDSSSAVGRGGSTGTYGPTAPKETLWSIGVAVRPDADVTMDQVLLALYETNPDAFVGGLGGLQKGVTLRVPDAARMQAVDPATAKIRVARLRSGLSPEPAAKAEPVAAKAAETASAAVAKPAPAPAPKTPKKAAAEPASSHDLSSSLASGSITPAAPGKPSEAEPVSALNGSAKSSTASESTTSASTASSKATEPAVPPPSSSIAVAPPAPAAVAPATTTTDAAATASGATPATSAAAPATQPAGTPAAADSAAVVAPAAAAAAPATQVQPPQSGAFDGLLIPILVIVVILLLISFLLWRRRLAGQSSPPPIALTPKSNLKVATAIGAAAGAAAAAAANKRKAPLQTSVPSMFDDEPDALLDFNKPNRPAAASALGGVASLPEFTQAKPKESPPLTMSNKSDDPIAAADFNLAYGLYDEAISGLKSAIAKEPGRLELQTKLVETYAAAGKPIEFQEAAEHLHGQVPDAEWQKIALLGRKVSPDAAIFKKDSPVSMEPDFDMTLDAMSRPAAAAAPSSPAFSIADMPQIPAAVSPAATASSGMIDFDIEKELLSEPITAAAPAAPKSELDSLDLSEFDLGSDSAKKVDDINSVDFSFDELDLSHSGSSEASSGFGDEVGTNLDLARAYVDMGDNEAARDLLNEVVAKGSATQKQEAAALLQRLTA